MEFSNNLSSNTNTKILNQLSLLKTSKINYTLSNFSFPSFVYLTFINCCSNSHNTKRCCFINTTASKMISLTSFPFMFHENL